MLSTVTNMLDDDARQLSLRAAPILHCDQCWQYQHKNYQKKLAEHGITQSVIRKGNCPNNAVIENFFGLLTSKLLYLQEFDSMEHFKQQQIEYLDYYNNH